MSLLYRALQQATKLDKPKGKGRPNGRFVRSPGKHRTKLQRLPLWALGLAIAVIGGTAIYLWPTSQEAARPTPARTAKLSTTATVPVPARPKKVSPQEPPQAPAQGSSDEPTPGAEVANTIPLSLKPIPLAQDYSRTDIMGMVVDEARRQKIPVPLALAVAKVASNFGAHAQGISGARGIMQITSKLARDDYGLDPDDLWDPRKNIHVGLDFLKKLSMRYDGRWDLALSHYNAGRVSGSQPDAEVHPASQKYVETVLRWQQRYSDDPPLSNTKSVTAALRVEEAFKKADEERAATQAAEAAAKKSVARKTAENTTADRRPAPPRKKKPKKELDSETEENPLTGVTITDETGFFRDRYEKAQRALRADQADVALAIYDKILRNQPRDPVALLGRAAALHQLDRVGDAIQAYKKLLRQDPSSRLAMTSLLGLIGRQAPDKALKEMRLLYPSNPDYSPLLAQMGMLHAQLGDTANAIEYLRRAAMLEPKNIIYQYNLAVVYDHAGQAPAAVQHYAQTLKLAAVDSGMSQLSLQGVRERLHYLRSK